MARPPIGAVGYSEYEQLTGGAGRRLPSDREFARSPEGRQKLRDEQRKRSMEGTVMVEPTPHGKHPYDQHEMTDADFRELIRHPTAGPFRSSGGAQWPLDGFTMRRIKDGDIKVVEQQEKEKEERPPRPRRDRTQSASEE